MPEYLGYKEREGQGITEWSKLSGQIGEKLDTAIGTRSRERDAFAETRKKNEDLINSYEVGQNQTLNTLIFDGANDIKAMMYDWSKAADNGEMTRAEYTQKHNNIMDYWGSLATSAKTFDDRTMETLKRQQADENGVIAGSGFELYRNRQHSEIANLKNKKIYTNPNTGVIYLAEYDDSGNIVNQTDVRQMNNPGNTIDNRVNMSAAVQNGTKDWQDWTVFTEGARGSSSTVINARKNPSFIAAKKSLVGSILSNSRAAASVLVDNSDGGYEFYASENELDAKIEKSLAGARAVADEAGLKLDEEMFIEEKMKTMILTERDETGVFQPMLTEQQMEAARGYVSHEIEVQVGFEKKGTVKRAPRYYSGGGGGGVVTTTTDDGIGTTMYDEMLEAWNLGGKSSGNKLTSLSGGDHTFRWEKGGMTVMENTIVPLDKQEDDRNYSAGGRPIIAYGLKDMIDISPYFYGTGTGAKGVTGGVEQYKKDREASRARRRKNKPKQTNNDSDPLGLF